MRHASRFTPFLLLVLWLNACLGWSWHEAAHLRQALQPAARTIAVEAAVAMGVDEAGGPSVAVPLEASPEDTHASHRTCAACLAFAHLQATAPQSMPPFWPEALGSSPRPTEKAGAAHGRRTARPFLARAPPAGAGIAPAAPVGAA